MGVGWLAAAVVAREYERGGGGSNEHTDTYIHPHTHTLKHTHRYCTGVDQMMALVLQLDRHKRHSAVPDVVADLADGKRFVK